MIEPQFSFGAWIKRRRQVLGFTQDELAQRVGCAIATIRKLESDERRPSVQIAELLAGQLALEEPAREAFLRCARGELAADQLPDPAGQSPVLASGTLTFLLASADTGAAWWQEHPQALRSALARYDRIVRGVCSAQAGHVFKSAGDTLYVAFVLPAAAVVAAVESQRALRREAWGSPSALQIRMAIHSGVVNTEQGDYTGLPINRANRLLLAAHGGQVLLSHAAEQLARDDLPDEIGLRDLGEQRLRDLSRPQRIFQLQAPDLPTDFPPLLSLPSVSSSLPTSSTALIGRESEIAAVGELIRRLEVRLVTLTGPGGTGKTRLAIEVGARLTDYFDSVAFVALAPIRDPALVIAEIARSLELRIAPNQSLTEQVKHELRARRALLLLDNFEQVTGAAPLLAELLAGAPDLKLLVTSRSVLQLSGEHAFSVPPLALPDPGRMPSLDQLSLYDAVALFVSRAAAARPGFAISNATAPAVAEICYRLDGLPLAIELAAARVRLFGPQELLARLRSPLAVLTGGARDMPERHQTLRKTLAWSYELMGASEQRLFARLGVFVGGCTAEAAEAICAADEELAFDVIDGIAALLDQSMLRRDDADGDQLRVAMLETIREYAQERLAESGALEQTRERHAAHFLILAETAAPELTGAEQERWLARLEHEHDNFRAAITWSLGAKRWDQAARLGAALWRFWWLRGHAADWRRWVEQILVRIDELETASAAGVLSAAGILSHMRGDNPQAIQLLEQSLERYRMLGDRVRMAALMMNMGTVATRLGDYRRALALAEEGHALYKELKEPHGIAVTLGCMGDAAYAQGDLPRAEAWYTESLRLVRELGSQFDTALYLHNLGEVHRRAGHLEQAEVAQAECLNLFRALEIPFGIGLALNSLGAIRHQLGDDRAALPLFIESLALAQQHENYQQIGFNFIGIALVLAAAGRTDLAARLLAAASSAFTASEGPLIELEQQEVDAAIATVRGNYASDAWEAAWMAGHALPLDQAVAEALAVIA